MESKKIDVKKSLEVCPNCSYRDGFHIMLERNGKELFSLKLVCPNCSMVFDAGLKIVSEQ